MSILSLLSYKLPNESMASMTVRHRSIRMGLLVGTTMLFIMSCIFAPIISIINVGSDILHYLIYLLIGLFTIYYWLYCILSYKFAYEDIRLYFSFGYYQGRDIILNYMFYLVLIFIVCAIHDSLIRADIILMDKIAFPLVAISFLVLILLILIDVFLKALKSIR